MAKKKTQKNAKTKDEKASRIVQIESTIIELRGERVILDSDLAKLYSVETKRLNQQVSRNADRFGEKY